jgi:hypothetical protein
VFPPSAHTHTQTHTLLQQCLKTGWICYTKQGKGRVKWKRNFIYYTILTCYRLQREGTSSDEEKRKQYNRDKEERQFIHRETDRQGTATSSQH